LFKHDELEKHQSRIGQTSGTKKQTNEEFLDCTLPSFQSSMIKAVAYKIGNFIRLTRVSYLQKFKATREWATSLPCAFNNT